MRGHMFAATFVSHYKHQLTAAGAVLVAGLIVVLVNRTVAARAERLARAVTGGALSQEADTRLRFLMRIADVVIILIGVSIALSQFAALDHVANTILASSAIAAAVVGFAARQPLANAIAGLILTIAQPLRIGDSVTFEGETGVVEDVRLSSTWLRTPAGSRVIIPNERLAAGVLRNESIVVPQVAVEVSLWLTPEADAVGAVDALRAALPEHTVRIAETTAEGTRLLLIGAPATAAERARHEAELREEGLRALRDAVRT